MIEWLVGNQSMTVYRRNKCDADDVDTKLQPGRDQLFPFKPELRGKT